MKFSPVSQALVPVRKSDERQWTVCSVLEQDAQLRERWLHHLRRHRSIVVTCHRKLALPENRRDGLEIDPGVQA